MASLPFQSSFCTINDLLSEFLHGDDGVGADLGAAGAGNALGDVCDGRGVIALAVDDGFVNGDDMLGTQGGAQLAPFSAVGIECYLGIHYKKLKHLVFAFLYS